MTERKEPLMPQRRTLHLTDEQRRTLVDYRDHDRRPYLRERCAALTKNR